MARSGRRRARRGPANNTTTVPIRRIRRLINKSQRGNEFRPTADPPEYVSCPWWPMTVVMDCDSKADLTPKQVYTALIKVLSWDVYVNKSNSTVPMELRFLSVRAWGLTKQPIELTIYDFDSTSYITEVADFGGAISFSRVGWKWGVQAMAQVYESSSDSKILELSGKLDATNKALVYIQVLVRCSSTRSPSLVYTTNTASVGSRGSFMETLCKSGITASDLLESMSVN